MTKVNYTREDDERLLEMLRLRKRGLSSYEIARRFGLNRATASFAMTMVRIDDLALSGERRGAVLREYWA